MRIVDTVGLLIGMVCLRCVPLGWEVSPALGMAGVVMGSLNILFSLDTEGE